MQQVLVWYAPACNGTDKQEHILVSLKFKSLRSAKTFLREHNYIPGQLFWDSFDLYQLTRVEVKPI